MSLKGESEEELFKSSELASSDDRERGEGERSEASPTYEERPPRLEVHLLARALGRPRRNGLLMTVVGGALSLSSIVRGILFGEYYPAPIPLGLVVAVSGLWLMVVPVPEGAADRLLGKNSGGGRWWIAWQLGMGGSILLGAALGVALLFWFDPI